MEIGAGKQESDARITGKISALKEVLGFRSLLLPCFNFVFLRVFVPLW
jgi:hypothetical protein